MHDLNTIRRMDREASLAAIAESVTEADEVAERAELAAATERHPAGKGRGKRLTEPAIDPTTEPEPEPEQDERTTKPLGPAEVAHLASASAHELGRDADEAAADILASIVIDCPEYEDQMRAR